MNNLILLRTLSGAFAEAKEIAICLMVGGALVAGFRIYQGMQKGDEFEGPALRWFGGMLTGIILVYGVENIIYGGGWKDKGPVNWKMLGYLSEGYQAAIYLGIMVAIFGLIRVYKKFKDGDDDVQEFMFKWFGSLMFLFAIGWIINMVFNYTN